MATIYATLFIFMDQAVLLVYHSYPFQVTHLVFQVTRLVFQTNLPSVT